MPRAGRLDRAVFSRWMAVLGDRFGRELGEPTQKLYYDTLDAHLTTGQFELAARACFDHETFWPAPMRLVARVKPGTGARALEQWNRLLDAVRQGQRAELDEHGRAALRDVGGGASIERCDEQADLPHIRRAFLTAYRERAASLPQPGPTPAALELPAILGRLS